MSRTAILTEGDDICIDAETNNIHAITAGGRCPRGYVNMKKTEAFIRLRRLDVVVSLVFLPPRVDSYIVSL